MANPLCHFELMTGDPEKCRAFYGAVFDWQFDDKTMPGYSLVDTGTEPIGGVFKKPESSLPPCANIYFQVSDIEDSLKRATDHGATVLVQKTKIPGVGHFAMFTDPEGIVIGLMQSNA